MGDTCPALVASHGGWRHNPCGRPIKRDGLCGIHAAAKEKMRANDEAAQARTAEAQVIVDRLAAHGVSAYANRDGCHITTSPKALADLLDGGA